LILNKLARLGLATAAFTFAIPAFAGVVAVTPDNATSLNWYWFNDVDDTALPNTISDAQTPPSSLLGSVNMSLPDAIGTQKPLVFTTSYAGLLLSDLTALSFQTYVVGGTGTTATPFFQLGLGTSTTDTAFRGRLSFTPTASSGGTLVTDTWQTWDALSATGGWFFSRPASFTSETCTLANPGVIGTSNCSLSAILSRNPGLAINAAQGLGLLGVRSNSNLNQQEQSYTDTITVQVGSSEATTFDFTTPEPSTMALLGSALVGLSYFRRRRQA
jgi:hypothetical protein